MKNTHVNIYFCFDIFIEFYFDEFVDELNEIKISPETNTTRNYNLVEYDR